MSTATAAKLRRLEETLGELLQARSGRDLSAFEKYADDPVGFVGDVLHASPWAAQERIARELVEHRRVVVRSCNSAGKDWLAARLALWWVYARRGFVLVTGPTERQVREIVFGEIRGAFRDAQDLPGELYEQALRVDREGKVGVLGFTSSDASRLTGFHAPRLLVVVTEAQGVEAHAWEGMLACATGSDSAVLAVGNPLQPDGMFYRVSNSPDWSAIRIRASDHPNVREGREVIPGGISPEWVELMARTYGEGSMIYRARVEGEFPDSAEDSLIPRSWIDEAIQRHADGALEGQARDMPVVWALDVARFGADFSALVTRQGPVVRDISTWGQASTMTTVGRALQKIASTRWSGERPGVLVVDEPGVGGGVLDRLQEQVGSNWALRRHVARVEGFHGGRRPQSGVARFFNRRAEAYWTLREVFEAGEIAIPDNRRLATELASIRWTVSSTGKIQIEPKAETRARLGSSPDLADALAIAFSVPVSSGAVCANIRTY